MKPPNPRLFFTLHTGVAAFAMFITAIAPNEALIALTTAIVGLWFLVLIARELT